MQTKLENRVLKMTIPKSGDKNTPSTVTPVVARISKAVQTK
jgi:hypothetical protein